MVQKVIKIGSSAGVTIPKKQLKELGISIGDEVNVSVEAINKLKKDDKKIAKLTMNFINRYRGDLEALSRK